MVRHRNGVVQVFKIDGQNNSDPKASPIQKYGTIKERITVRHYGDALQLADQIEGKK